MKRERFAFVTIVPSVWLLVCTVTAGLQKVFHSDPAIGFLSHAAKFSAAAASGTLLAPANTVDQMSRIVFNDYLDAGLAGLSVAIVLVVVVYAIVDIARALGSPTSTAVEVGGATLAAAE
jgi:carbon starvation protein